MLFAVFKIYSFSRGELSQGSSLVGELGEDAANNEWWLPTFDDLDNIQWIWLDYFQWLFKSIDCEFMTWLLVCIVKYQHNFDYHNYKKNFAAKHFFMVNI